MNIVLLVVDSSPPLLPGHTRSSHPQMGCCGTYLSRDPDELTAEGGTLADFASACRRDGISSVAVLAAVGHLQRYVGGDARPKDRPRFTGSVDAQLAIRAMS